MPPYERVIRDGPHREYTSWPQDSRPLLSPGGDITNWTVYEKHLKKGETFYMLNTAHVRSFLPTIPGLTGEHIRKEYESMEQSDSPPKQRHDMDKRVIDVYFHMQKEPYEVRFLPLLNKDGSTAPESFLAFPIAVSRLSQPPT